MKSVRYVGKKACIDPAYLAACSNGGDGTAVVDALPDGGNVALTFKLFLNATQPPNAVQIAFPDRARDLLELGVHIYIADELADRASAPDGWTRLFDVRFPVREPDAWAAAEHGLIPMLSMLSGDQYRFSWPERSRIPLIGRHRKRVPRGYDAICLFSGGIDSLLGAHKLLSDGRKVLLVGHQADSLTAAAQPALYRALAKQFPGAVHLIQSRVARSMSRSTRFDLPSKVEETHRPRSFLFLCIAAALCSALGVQELYIPENGLIALNPPLQPSRLGSLSTRTAHPIFLTRLSAFLSTIGVYTGSLKNPFIYQSKTDMVRDADEELSPLLLRSVSCARPSRFNYLRVRHCGYCVACLYRRAAMAEAGLDRARDYAFDVFQNLAGCEAHKQIDFRAMVNFALALQRATALERAVIALSHGAFSPEVGAMLGPAAANDYLPWTDMLKRWADHFVAHLHSTCSPATKTILSLPRRSRERPQ